MDIILGGLTLTLIVSVGVAILVGACALSYWVCMGDDPFRGRFRWAGGCYLALGLLLTGTGLTLEAWVVLTLVGMR